MQLLRLNTAARLDIARHFGERLVRRGSGRLMFVGSMRAAHAAKPEAGRAKMRAAVS